MARTISIDRGLNLPIHGVPRQEIDRGSQISTVALLGADYLGMKPTMSIQEGDPVQTGQPLFEDKKNPGVVYTSPGTGKVAAIHRGPKRRFDALVIELNGDDGEACRFASHRDSI